MAKVLQRLMLLSVLGAGMTARAAHAEGDAGAGMLVFHKCQSCHAIKGGGISIGPSLFGVVGRRAGSLPNYHYSPALQKLGSSWDEEHLMDFLTAPAAFAPGNRMPFAGLKSAADRANVVAYLATLK